MREQLKECREEPILEMFKLISEESFIRKGTRGGITELSRPGF